MQLLEREKTIKNMKAGEEIHRATKQEFEKLKSDNEEVKQGGGAFNHIVLCCASISSIKESNGVAIGFRDNLSDRNCTKKL